MTGPRVLITGFEPFGQFATNPSEQVARALGERARWSAHILPVAFDECIAQITELVTTQRPDVVLSLGLAPARQHLCLERVALNLIDARIPDNTGAQPVDIPVVMDGPAAYFSTLPVKAMRRAVEDAGIAAKLSLSAGSYGCNAVMYTALHAAPEGTRAGFVHLPPADFLSLAEAERAVAAAVQRAVVTTRDDVVADGALD